MAITIALGWLLGVSPLLVAAKAADEAREAAQAQNSTYSQELATLKEEFEGIEQLEAELVDLRDELPASADLPGYLTQLAAAAQRHTVALTAITVADAVAYAPIAAEAPAEEPAADAEATEDAEAADAADAAAAPEPEVPPAVAGAGVPVTSPLVTSENFVSIPINLTVEGGYGNVLSFVESLQTGTRLSSVTAFSTSSDAEDPEASSGSDAVSGTVTVLIYVLLDPAAE